MSEPCERCERIEEDTKKDFKEQPICGNKCTVSGCLCACHNCCPCKRHNYWPTYYYPNMPLPWWYYPYPTPNTWEIT